MVLSCGPLFVVVEAFSGFACSKMTAFLLLLDVSQGTSLLELFLVEMVRIVVLDVACEVGTRRTDDVTGWVELAMACGADDRG